MDRYKTFGIAFFCDSRGKEPVREWLKNMPADLMKLVCRDITAASYWDVDSNTGISVQVDQNLWEIYNPVQESRVIFTVYEEHLILLNGVIDPSEREFVKYIKTGKKRLKQYMEACNDNSK